MSISYSGSQIQVLDDNGDPASGAKINFYEPGTTTRKDTYTDSNKGTVNPNPVITAANGRAQVWLSGGYKVITTDSADVSIGDTIDNYNNSTSTSNEGVLILNRSFENDTVVSGQPDNWTVSSGTGGTIAIDSSDQAHGLQSLKFTGTDATGGGNVTSNKFNVLENGELDIRFTYKSNAVDTLTKVDIKYYDSTGAVVSTLNVYSEGASNPSVYTSYINRITTPATAVQAELILSGIDSAGTTTVAITHFDDINVVEASNAVTSTVAGADVSQLIADNIGTSKEIKVDVSIIQDATGGASSALVINGDVVATNYYKSYTNDGSAAVKANDPFFGLNWAGNTENFIQMTVSPNSTSGETHIIIKASSWDGTTMLVTDAAIVWTGGGLVSSIGIRDSSGTAMIAAGSRITASII